MARAMAELCASRDAQPGTDAIDGSKSHTAATTPTNPAMAPPIRSIWRSGPIGRKRWNDEPMSNPNAWPANAAPRNRPAAMSSLLLDGSSAKLEITSGAK